MNCSRFGPTNRFWKSAWERAVWRRVRRTNALRSGASTYLQRPSRARENLAELNNIHLFCGDFLTFDFHRTFDVLYSSLTFFHFPDKTAALRRAFDLLRPNGRFVLSIDKNPSCTLDMGDRWLTLYPDLPEALLSAADAVGFSLAARRETEFAHLFCLFRPQ